MKFQDVRFNTKSPTVGKRIEQAAAELESVSKLLRRSAQQEHRAAYQECVNTIRIYGMDKAADLIEFVIDSQEAVKPDSIEWADIPDSWMPLK